MDLVLCAGMIEEVDGFETSMARTLQFGKLDVVVLANERLALVRGEGEGWSLLRLWPFGLIIIDAHLDKVKG